MVRRLPMTSYDLRKDILKLLRSKECGHDTLIIPGGDSEHTIPEYMWSTTYPNNVKPVPATKAMAAVKAGPRNRGAEAATSASNSDREASPTRVFIPAFFSRSDREGLEARDRDGLIERDMMDMKGRFRQRSNGDARGCTSDGEVRGGACPPSYINL